MKTFLFSCCCLFIVTACQPAGTPTTAEESEPASETVSPYPEALQAVFAAHGGLAQWNRQGALRYEISKEAGNESQIIDLKDRRERIEGHNFTMGYDGTNYWLEADTTEYKGNPIFYKNLMFYFYAMPFVLADQGVKYNKAAPLLFEGVSYPGFRISYEAGVGESPEDEYFIHYAPDTKEMAWLGYTVTYYSQEKSQQIKWIRYDDWMEVAGLKLPRTMAWYEVANNLPVAERNRRAFTEVVLSTDRPNDSVFVKTAQALIVEE